MHNPDHAHLAEADVGFFLGGISFRQKRRTVLGQSKEVMIRTCHF
ncbi:hypothetical protein BN1184_AM_01590 [Pantoea ananatis]|nr:hypothetical protein BN1184_AM_01590 [Pantoea ananatis]